MHLYLVYSKFSAGLAISNNIIVSDSMSKVHDICPRTSWILLGSLDIKVLSHYPLKCHASCHDFLLQKYGSYISRYCPMGNRDFPQSHCNWARQQSSHWDPLRKTSLTSLLDLLIRWKASLSLKCQEEVIFSYPEFMMSLTSLLRTTKTNFLKSS